MSKINVIIIGGGTSTFQHLLPGNEVQCVFHRNPDS